MLSFFYKTVFYASITSAGLFFLSLSFAQEPDSKEPRNPLETKIHLLYQQSKKATRLPRRTQGKVLLPLLKTLVDINHITSGTLGKYYSKFTEEEKLEYQRNFITLLLATLQIKSNNGDIGEFDYKFTNVKWDKETQIVALKIYLYEKPTPLKFIFEFEKTGQYLIDFHLNEESSIFAYRQQFEKIILQKGKEQFLKLLDRRASKIY